ncbi:ATP-binding cassette domain-containing protein [Paenibacillus sp. ClWae2A]|uniref:ABC transporter ATP-binding protein n=1 Tax=Paenibacillus sp. ClWae2A TaxID=3057177 RepID=UPI0028F62991|nr:ATP-binding cassette domain-containing protein [Paenibacillus sp. ClWae2A]MDT9722441.1 ATP-binding cassette domain-containing protein [Paenibacillus sp. ClWae2A]
MINVNNISKVFRRPIREKGFRGALRDFTNRKYENKKAVDDLSFSINQGEMVGFLGPNGAGKSTSIKMLVGILVPTNGEVRVNGIVPYQNRKENARRIGVVFGQRSQLWWDIPVIETLKLHKYMYGISDAQFKRNIELFSEVLGINEFLNVAVRQLSLGQRMRADLCAALMHNPEVIYLDEPTIGLDVVVKKKIREFLIQINRDYKTTILLTTHDMSDVEKLCSRVLVINHGKKIYDGDLEQLKVLHGSDEKLIVRMNSFNNERFLTDAYSLEVGVKKITCENDSNILNFYYDKREVSSTQILKYLLQNDGIKDFQVKSCELDEVIQRIYSN